MRRWIHWLLIAALALLLTVRLVGFGARMLQTLRFPYQYDPTEGIVLSEVRLLASGENIYAPFTPERFVSGPYPPVYYAALALPMKLFGPSFTWGRLAALAAALAISALLWLIVARRAGRWWALLPASLWLASTPLLVWGNRLKPDLWAVAFALAALTVFDADRRRLFWTALLCALAGYSKQSALAAPLAIMLTLLLQQPRAAWRFAGWMLVLVAVPFALLDLLTRHGFYIHMIDFHALPWSAQRWLGLLADMAAFHWALALASLALVPLVLRRSHPDLLWGLYVPLAALGTFSGGTFGGFHNHTLEFLAAICLGTGLLLAWTLQSDQQYARTALLALLLVQLALWWRTPDWLRWELGNLPTPERRTRMDNLARLVADQPQPVWSSNIGLLVTTGQPLRYNDPLIMAQSAMLGWWDERAFVDTIRQQRYGLILWRGDLDQTGRPNDLSPAMFDAIQQFYAIKYRDLEFVYAPRP